MFAGTYTLTETQPPNFLDGRDRAGTLGGVAGNDIITTIPVGLQQNGTSYEFGELGVTGPQQVLAAVELEPVAVVRPAGQRRDGREPDRRRFHAAAGAAAPPARLVTRTPAGTTAQLFDSGDGGAATDRQPFPGFGGRLAFAQADVTGDGVADLLVATAEGASHVKVFDGQSGAEVRSFLAFDGIRGRAVAGGRRRGRGRLRRHRRQYRDRRAAT